MARVNAGGRQGLAEHVIEIKSGNLAFQGQEE